MKIISKKDLDNAKTKQFNSPIKLDGQTRLVTRYIDVIDPENLSDYISIGGFYALEKSVNSLSDEEIIDIITKSGLRGRGGGGFSTGKKWQFAKAENKSQKFVVCNCDEGDPGAFMDRKIMEGNPFSVIEGLCIAGKAIGATEGVVYVRAEYPLAHERIKKAIRIAEEAGLLGKNIFNSGFDFDISVVLGAGAFVCGEETALISSCHGKRGEPTKKPPFPAVKGIFDQPTIINNVETLANVAQIVWNGADWFSSFGTKTSTGTKVFALSGAVKKPGLVELEMGTPLSFLVDQIGGGTLSGKPFKAVQLGGPSGGAIPNSLKDVTLDYDSLLAVNAMIGSGGAIVMDEDTCMVDIARFFLEFSCDESCGKCTPCRIGNKRMQEILEKICKGEANLADLEKLESVANYVKQNSLCGLGQTSPNPVLSTLKYFKQEFLDHIIEKKCTAGVCKNLVHFCITNKCIGCGACKRTCPVEAIKGEIRKPPFEICDDVCIRCGACKKTCPVLAIIKK